MPALTQHAVALGARVLQSRSRRSLEAPASGAQERAFRQLVQSLASCQYGREHGIHAGMDYRRFQSHVPLSTYETLAGHVENMKRGMADVLWPGVCRHYAVSSGTTAGRTKFLPITTPMLDHFRQTGLDSLLSYTRRVKRMDIFKGKHLFLGGSTALTPIAESAPFQAYAGDLSGITAVNMPAWVDRNLYEPGRDIAQITDWPEKLRAIAKKTWNRDIRVIAGIPSWLLILAEAVRAEASRHGKDARELTDLWPNLECLIHGGVPIGPYVDELRRAFGSSVQLHEVYPASEGFIAAQDSAPEFGLRLFVNAGIFYEFLPLGRYDESCLEELGAATLPLRDVQPDQDYALVMTTPAGLCRYLIGDVVRFTSVTPPRLFYVGRTKLQLSAFGEHVIEKELTDALTAACRRHGCTASNFHAAPSFADSTAGQLRGRHEWWIELSPNPTSRVAAETFSGDLDRELMRLNEDYEAKRAGGGLQPPLVHLVRPGVFQAWMQQQGKWGGQNKMPRCRSDRQIADSLNTVANASL